MFSLFALQLRWVKIDPFHSSIKMKAIVSPHLKERRKQKEEKKVKKGRKINDSRAIAKAEWVTSFLMTHMHTGSEYLGMGSPKDTKKK